MDNIPEVIYLKISGYLDRNSIYNYCNSSKSINKQRLYRLVYCSKLKYEYYDSLDFIRYIYEDETLSTFLRDINEILFNDSDNRLKKKNMFFSNLYKCYSIQFKNILHNRTVFINEEPNMIALNQRLHIMYRLPPLDIRYLKKANNRLILALIY